MLITAKLTYYTAVSKTVQIVGTTLVHIILFI